MKRAIMERFIFYIRLFLMDVLPKKKQPPVHKNWWLLGSIQSFVIQKALQVP